MKIHFNVNQKQTGNEESITDLEISRVFHQWAAERRHRQKRWKPEIQGGLQGSPLLQSLPKPWACDPRAAQKVPSPTHWTRAILSVWLRPQCILCLSCAEMEREEWSCTRVATGLMTGHLSSLWPPYQRSAKALPRLPAVGECCAHKLVSIQCQVQSVSCFPKYTLTWMFLSPQNNQRLWPQRGSDIKAVKPGFQVQGGAHKHTGCSSYQGMRPWTPSSCHFFRPLTRL